ncbi:MAG: lycopene cyclase domain-containing protein [Halobacteriales archaeon]
MDDAGTARPRWRWLPVIPAYLAFHAVFLLPALLALGLAARATFRREDAVGLAILVAMALAYTIPWDGYLIGKGVWWYGTGSVVATVWRVPVGELLFVVIQPVLTVLWLSWLGIRPDQAGLQTLRRRAAGATAGLSVAVLGGALLLREPTFYLGAILVWAGPILAIQWTFDWSYLWKRRRRVLTAVLAPTAYLAFADRIAIEVGIWSLSPRYTTGLAVGGLPVEEATFFLLTNLFVVQGLVLFRGLVVTLREHHSAELFRAAVPR